MSTGRHAKKRAAEAEERLMNEQEALLKKEERKKGALEKDTETQRIATMRARFGGQASDQGASTPSTASTSNADMGTMQNKYKTPNKLISGSDPMRKTIMGMMLGNDQQQAG